MSAITLVAGIGNPSAINPQSAIETLPTPSLTKANTSNNFGEMLTKGLEMVDSKMNVANNKVMEFAIDDTVPIHHVTIALEEARLAVELAMQVRSRLVEGYREIMNMQL